MSKVLPVSDLNETFLYQELIRRNDPATRGLLGNLAGLCEVASERAKSVSGYFPEFTLHDQTHFLRVTQLMALVIGDTLGALNDVEICLLILSAFYHDQGMVLAASEKDAVLASEAFILFRENWLLEHPNYAENRAQLENPRDAAAEYEKIYQRVAALESALLTDYLRIQHGQRSADYIKAVFSNDQRLTISSVNLSSLLALLCLSHVQEPDWIRGHPDFHPDENVGTYRVNMIYCALVLRLADILDFDADRTPDVLFKSIHFTSPVSVQEWQKHRGVQGWEISAERIRFTMSFEHPVYEKCARDFLDWIDQELVAAQQLVRTFPQAQAAYRLAVPEKTDRSRISAKNNAYVFHDLEFSLSRDEVVKLLMTNNLYKSPSLFIRELLQNALDALRLRKANFEKDEVSWDKGQVWFLHATDKNGEQFVECKDNGCGMDMEVISRFFGKVGRSYYRSPEFQRHRLSLKAKGVDFEPCAQFGIGFMSCFMIGDRVEIATRKDYGPGKNYGPPLLIEINGLGGLMVIKDGKADQEIGTTVRVYSRDKRWIYDSWSDNIRLLTVLNGYALATEFPIEAVCTIPEIKGSVSIPVEMDKKQTFLEEFGLSAIKTYEVDLSTINPNLRGFLRQSFLTDEQGQLCMENQEAKWGLIGDEDWKDKPLKVAIINKLSGMEAKLERYSRDEHTVCLDGILICGAPGRYFHTRMEMGQLGMRNAIVHVEHPFTIDVRGNIKPEISPAREPADEGSVFNRPPGWGRLQQLLDIGSGNLWEQVLAECAPELFWTLLAIYHGDAQDIASEVLYRHVSLPVADQTWLALSAIDRSQLSAEGIAVTDLAGSTSKLSMLGSVAKFDVRDGSPPKDWNFLFEKILIGMSSLELSGGELSLKMRRDFKPQERPFDNRFQAYRANIHCLEFIGLSPDHLCTAGYDYIVNLNHPLVRKGLQKVLEPINDSLYDFAYALIVFVPQLMQHLKEKGKDLNFNYKGRSLKIIGHHYLRVNWENHSPEFKPPYKVYVDQQTTLELTNEILTNWGKILLGEND